MRIFATNPIVDYNPNTNLSASSITGATSLSIYNNIGFSLTTNLALLSQYGDEQAEVVKTSTTTTNSMSLSSGTLFPHPQDTLVSFITYDQVEFSRSDDGGTTWSVLATVSIQADRKTTVYVDTNGSANSLWRFRFYNSLTSVYSGYSSTIGSSGYSFYQLESLVNRIVSLFQDPDLQLLTFSDISDWVNECSEELAGEIYMADKMGLINFVSNTISPGATNITCPDDFVKLKRLELSYDNGVTYYKAVPQNIDTSYFAGGESSANQQFGQTGPVYWRQDNTIYFLPVGPSPTNYKLWYYRLPTYVVNPGDKLDLVFRPFTRLYVDYCEFRAKQKDKKPGEAKSFLSKFEDGKASFIENVTRWQLDEPDTIDPDDMNYVAGATRIAGRL